MLNLLSGQNNSQNKPKGAFADVAPTFFFRLALVFVVLLIGWNLLSEVAGLGGGLGETIMGWFESPSIDPRDRSGFESLLKLLLCAVGLSFLISWLKKG